MNETVIESRTLPEPLLRYIGTEKVKVREQRGEIRLIPIADGEADCPLRGVATDCGFTVDEFLARKRAEKALEDE